MSVSAASTTHTETSGNHYQLLTLDMADISCTLEMAASCIHACISQYQNEAANSNVPSASQITHFKAGLQWEISTFVTPLLQYSAARHIISVVPTPVAHILALFPMLTWNMLQSLYALSIFPLVLMIILSMLTSSFPCISLSPTVT
ncbi:hypothetical protein BDR04DRAFT_1160135 [Suillus decipiens]|nr:hypothetical protein BDR04DRAFT_1160135 [Suillus decipiens]